MVCAHASKHHTIAILSPNSIIYYITMQRSFGTEISGNRRPGAEISDIRRARIFSTVEAGKEKTLVVAFTIQSIDRITILRLNLCQGPDSPKTLLDARGVYFFESYARILKSII